MPHHRSVLICEDEDVIRRSLAELLASEGYVVSPANKVADAVALAMSHDFDVAICDVMLPDGDGIDLLKRLIRLNPRTAVLVITAYATVENAVDTSALNRDLADVSPSQRAANRARRGWSESDVVGIYCGSLYPNKRLDLLVEAGKRIHAEMPSFRLLVVGGGPEAGWMAQAAATHAQWLRYEGPRFGADKVACLSMAQVCLNPGLVGLGILDGFCAGLPMITTDLPVHSPEIEYLEAGVNGLMTPPRAADYADGVLALLRDPPRLAAMRAAARAAAERFSIETMVGNFSAGVRQCLQR